MPQSIERILIIGGTHGVEPQSTYVVEKLAKHFKFKEQQLPELDQLFKLYRGTCGS